MTAESESRSPVNQYRADPVAETNWQRYTYGKNRGHRTYQAIAQRCERFYLGGGLQWSQADRQKLLETGNRPAYEWNGIMPAVNAAIGYQIHNRMDLEYLPRGGLADTTLATVRTKVAKQICDQQRYHFKETQVFADGLIEQRGYFEARMCFDNNVYGDVEVLTHDPLDVIPDPDAKTYDPDGWYDVIVTRWYNIDEIEGYYGKEAADKVRVYLDAEPDWGQMDDESERNKFGTDSPSMLWDAWLDEAGLRRFRIVDRQRWQYKMSKVAIYPTGDVKDIESSSPELVAQMQADGAVIGKRMRRSVLWQVTTRWCTLHDTTSPYPWFTIVPYFAYFRRGVTRGMVDNAIGPQEVVNKAISQFVHIVNTTANSGWIVQENSLVNMTPEQLQLQGSATGLLVIYKQGTEKPEKIQPNTAPAGMDRLIELAMQQLKDVTTPDAMRGLADTPEVSGIAIQSKQFASQQQLAVPLDNMAFTRYMMGSRFNWLISNFMDNHRIFRITEIDPTTGKDFSQEYEVNKFDPITQSFSNDMTAGDYDVVVSEAPLTATFENNQFMQGLELRKAGVAIPDSTLIKHSSLADKGDILTQMAAAPPNSDPLTTAKAALAQAQSSLAQAQAEKVAAETVNTNVTAMFGATQAATQIVMQPTGAPLADQLLRSAGFKDQDAPPIVPSPSEQLPPALPAPGGAPPLLPHNTDPLTPAKPATGDVGARAGIEGGAQ